VIELKKCPWLRSAYPHVILLKIIELLKKFAGGKREKNQTCGYIIVAIVSGFGGDNPGAGVE
jgi:hypothetical protein